MAQTDTPNILRMTDDGRVLSNGKISVLLRDETVSRALHMADTHPAYKDEIERLCRLAELFIAGYPGVPDIIGLIPTRRNGMMSSGRYARLDIPLATTTFTYQRKYSHAPDAVQLFLTSVYPDDVPFDGKTHTRHKAVNDQMELCIGWLRVKPTKTAYDDAAVRRFLGIS